MKNKKLLLLRYFILIILIFSIISQENANINAFGIILILLLIINNQMRIFTLENRKRLFCLSIILEWVLSFIIYKNYGGFLIFYFIISIIDGTILLENKFSILFNIFTIFIMIFMSKSLDTDILIYNISILGIISILSLYIKDEYLRIIKAEDLYYRLKISEENLIKANKDLEIYADSIKELSILRERNRISREIHDSVGHSLSTIIIQLGAIEKIAEENGELASQMARNLNEFSKKSLEEIRIVLRQLKPPSFQKYENIQIIEELTKEFTKFTGIEVDFRFTEEKWQLNEKQSLTIYRIVQEFLSNSLRHGKATKVNIYLNYNEDELILTLKDNGQGIDKLEKGLGLTNIWERVEELGGQIEYNSKVRKGFLLRVVLRPVENLEF
ncbi:MAG: sensor histidine kinase [Tissierellia bacterium]|nr:sensor histidine kinase [Tissierellia bacterium]